MQYNKTLQRTRSLRLHYGSNSQLQNVTFNNFVCEAINYPSFMALNLNIISLTYNALTVKKGTKNSDIKENSECHIFTIQTLKAGLPGAKKIKSPNLSMKSFEIGQIL
jgi:hypothetical protein